MNIPKFQTLISFTELITNLKKLCFSHKRYVLLLKEQSRPPDGVAFVVQKYSMYCTSFQYW